MAVGLNALKLSRTVPRKRVGGVVCKSQYHHLIELEPFLFPPKKAGEFCVIAFKMDDSADQKRKKVFVVAGFVGTSVDWFEVTRHWERYLEQAGIDYFRTNECITLKGEFLKVVERCGPKKAREAANELLKSLKLVVKASNLRAYCLGVLMQDYLKVLSEPEGSNVLMPDPYLHAHQQLIHAVASAAAESPRQPLVAFSYDQSNKAAALQNSWAIFKERNPIAAECMGTLSPLDDKLFSSIQVADLIANSAKKAFEKKIDSGQPLRRAGSAVELEELSEWFKHVDWVGYWNEEYLRDMVKGNLKYSQANSDKEFWRAAEPHRNAYAEKARRGGTIRVDAPFEEAVKKILKAEPAPKKSKRK